MGVRSELCEHACLGSTNQHVLNPFPLPSSRLACIHFKGVYFIFKPKSWRASRKKTLRFFFFASFFLLLNAIRYFSPNLPRGCLEGAVNAESITVHASPLWARSAAAPRCALAVLVSNCCSLKRLSMINFKRVGIQLTGSLPGPCWGSLLFRLSLLISFWGLIVDTQQ